MDRSGPTAQRGEVFDVQLDPTKGREQRGTRPAVILSRDQLNQRQKSGWPLLVVPFTRTDHDLSFQPRIYPSQNNGLDEVSFAMTDQMRAVSPSRLVNRRGVLSGAALTKIEKAVIIVLKLESHL